MMNRRIRFSLMGMLTTTLIVALTATTVVLHQRIRVIEPALLKLRNEVGELTVDDPELPHAIRIPDYDDTSHRWRLHLPAEKKFVLRCAVSTSIPAQGIPSIESSKCFMSWEFRSTGVDTDWIQAIAFDKNRQGVWRLVLSRGSEWHSVSRPLPDEMQGWLEEEQSPVWSISGKGATVSAKPGEPLILFRQRRVAVIEGEPLSEEPTTGVVAWIEELDNRGFSFLPGRGKAELKASADDVDQKPVGGSVCRVGRSAIRCATPG